MEIYVAENAGFCFGVKRAVKMAFDAAENYQGRVHSLGPLIHNPQVVERLAEKGVQKVERLNQIEKGVVILRSHGVSSPQVVQDAEAQGLHIIDATDASGPVLLGTFNSPGSATGIEAIGRTVLIADGAFGLHVVDASDPAAPALIGSHDLPGSALNLAEHAGLAAVASGKTGIFLLDAGDCPLCPFDLDGSGTLDLFDFLAFVGLFEAADPAADADGNGALDVFDFLAFVNGFEAGCG